MAILRAVSKAIAGATSPDELFPRVCDAAIFGGHIQGAAILLADADKGLRFVAGAGDGLEELRALKRPADPEVVDRDNASGARLQADRPILANDLSSEERMKIWLEEATRDGIGAFVPIQRRGSSIDRKSVV